MCFVCLFFFFKLLGSFCFLLHNPWRCQTEHTVSELKRCGKRPADKDLIGQGARQNIGWENSGNNCREQKPFTPTIVNTIFKKSQFSLVTVRLNLFWFISFHLWSFVLFCMKVELSAYIHIHACMHTHTHTYCPVWWTCECDTQYHYQSFDCKYSGI